MKRIWIGIGLLVALLVAGLWVADRMEDTHLEAARQLDQSVQMARNRDWKGAQGAAIRARGIWEGKRKFTASFADHEPMDAVDALFAELEIHASRRDPADYCAAAAHLARRLEAMAGSHSLTWWNLL